MRRLGVFAVFAALVLAGCGSSSSSAGSSNPVGTELSYLPAGSAFVLSVQTDPHSPAITQLNGLLHRFQLASFGTSALIAKLEQYGIDYQADIKPLFGNPVMFGFANGLPTTSTAGSGWVLAWVTKDSSKLSALVKKLKDTKAAGSHDGASLYQSSGGTPYTLAVDGPTLVFGASRSIVGQALDRHAHGGGMSSSSYTQAFANLPANGFVQIFGDISKLIAEPALAKARSVPWVAALRGYAVSIGASPTGLTFSYRLDTSGGTLTADQVPIASGNGTPTLAGSLPITASIQDPAHIVSFIESVEQSTGSASWAGFQRDVARLKAKTGVDLNSLLKVLTGELIVASDTHTTMARAVLSSPSAVSDALARLAAAPKSALKSSSITRLGGGFYADTKPGQTITLGVVGNQFVIGKASADQLRSFAAAPATPAPGAQGSVAFRITLTQLLSLATHSAPSGIEQQILSSLGDITGWMSATPSALTGSATLAIH